MDDQYTDQDGLDETTPDNPEAFYLALKYALERLKEFDEPQPPFDEPVVH